MNEQLELQDSASEETPDRSFCAYTGCLRYELDQDRRVAGILTGSGDRLVCKHLEESIFDKQGTPTWSDGTPLERMEFFLMLTCAPHALKNADDIFVGYCHVNGDERLCTCAAIPASEALDG